MAQENLFPSIGSLAQQADVSNGDNNGADNPSLKDDDDRVVQEIESLCVQCEEQVGTNFSHPGC